MTKATDFYAVLGVSPASDDVVIRAAFKALMLKYHPDTNRSPDATARAAAINEAFAVLGDPERRAAYDASRRERSAPPAPPSPPSPPPGRNKSATHGSARPKVTGSTGRPAWLKTIGRTVALLLVAGVVRIAVVEALRNSNAPSSSAVMASGTTDTMSDNASGIANNWKQQTIGEALDLAGNTQAPVTLPTSSGNFDYQPPTSIDFKVIGGAGNTFAKIITSKGLSGARSWSESCHDKATKKPGWAEADRCAAFDYAASYMDQGMAKATNTSPNTYFAFETENQADNYKTVGAMPFTVNDRLQHIRQAVEPVTYEAVMAIVHQREKSSPVDPASDGPSNGPTDGGPSNQTGG